MKHLLNCHGKRFRAKIEGVEVEGKITVEDGYAFLCQNEKDGKYCDEKHGYKYSWAAYYPYMPSLTHDVTDLQFLKPKSPEEIESYMDWQEGDVLVGKDGYEFGTVIFRHGKLVVLERNGGNASSNYTCQELHNEGWRLKSEPKTKLTKQQIAEKFGLSVDQIEIEE